MRLSAAPQFNLPPEAFPMTLRFFRTDTNELVYEMKVEEPRRLYIPPLAGAIGQSVRVECRFADGTVHRQGPPQ